MKSLSPLFLIISTCLMVALTNAQIFASINLFELFNNNNTLQNIFGTDTNPNDNSSLRISSAFLYTGLAIFKTPPGVYSFTNESFHDRLLKNLPTDWQTDAIRRKFRERLIILEYCSWEMTTSTFNKPCEQLTAADWNRFVLSRADAPACTDAILGLGQEFKNAPYVQSDNATLVRFAFDGADREEYYSAFFDLNTGNGNQLGVCQLSGAGFATQVAAATRIDKPVRAYSQPLPTRIQTEWNRLTRAVLKNPGNAGAIVAIIVILIVFGIGYCIYSCLNRKQKVKDAENAARQLRDAAATIERRYEVEGGNANNAERQKFGRYDEPDGGVGSRNYGYNNNRSAADNVIPSNQQQQKRVDNNNDDDDDPMMAEIAAARRRIAQQKAAAAAASTFTPSNADERHEVEMMDKVPPPDDHHQNFEINHTVFNPNNDDKEHTDSRGNMGIGATLFGLPRDGDQPAILAAAATNNDTSLHGDDDHHADGDASKPRSYW